MIVGQSFREKAASKAFVAQAAHETQTAFWLGISATETATRSVLTHHMRDTEPRSTFVTADLHSAPVHRSKPPILSKPATLRAVARRLSPASAKASESEQGRDRTLKTASIP